MVKTYSGEEAGVMELDAQGDRFIVG